MKKTILALIATSGYSSAAISVTGGFATDLRGADPSISPDVGDLFLLVASTTDNSFDGLLAGDSLTVGSTLGGGDDIIFFTGSLVDFGGGVIGAQTSFNNVDTSGLIGLGEGDSYSLIWFDGVTSSSSSLAGGESYGIAREANWVIPPSGLTEGVDSIVTQQLASLTVASIPEPSSAVLLGLGGLALITRRKKN